ncbi:MAG: orotate phosphoribosyltransferase [Candidatus Omnitrophota bacterium]
MPNRQDTQELKQRLFALLKERAYREGNIVLSSGKIGSYYIDARVVTLSAEGAYLTAALILDLVKDKNISAIGGPTLGADPLLGAIAALSFLDKKPLNTFIVRKIPKEHGTQKRIEGPALKKGDKVIIVDDVVTSGGSLLDCISILRQSGVIVEGAVAIIDREEGAIENLARVSCPLTSIFKASDFKISKI